MFKSKKTTYYLIIISLLLWLYIVYIVGGFSNDEKEKIVFDQHIPSKQRLLKNEKRDSSFVCSNINPFGIIKEISINDDRHKANVNLKKRMNPSIEYLGYVIKQNGQIYANIFFNKRFYILREWDTIGGFTVSQINKDSLLIMDDNLNFYISKQH